MKSVTLENFKEEVNKIYSIFSTIAEVEHIVLERAQTKMELSGIFIITYHRTTKGKNLHRSIPFVYGSIEEPWKEADLLPFLPAIEGKGFDTIYLLEDPMYMERDVVGITKTSAPYDYKLVCTYLEYEKNGIANRLLWKVCLSCKNDIVYHSWQSSFRGTCPSCCAVNNIDLMELDWRKRESADYAWGTTVTDRWLGDEEE